eukprot:1139899-Pelagomonas_calceolata.AAC.1
MKGLCMSSTLLEYGTVWEEALESERRGPENKEAYFSRRKQTWGCAHLKITCFWSCTSSWASQASLVKAGPVNLLSEALVS